MSFCFNSIIYFNALIKSKGIPDAIIIPSSVVDKSDFSKNISIGFEFKHPFTIDEFDSKKHAILEFLATLESRSNQKLPVLFVLTDLYTFKFIWMSDENDKVIDFFETQDLRYSIKLIEAFLNEHNKRLNSNDATMKNDGIINCYKIKHKII